MHRNGTRYASSWRCAVKNSAHARDHYERNTERVCKRERDRYDADPFYRIPKLLQNAAHKRKQTLAAARARMEAERHSALPE
jgi:hypothetical protein